MCDSNNNWIILLLSLIYCLQNINFILFTEGSIVQRMRTIQVYIYLNGFLKLMWFHKNSPVLPKRCRVCTNSFVLAIFFIRKFSGHFGLSCVFLNFLEWLFIKSAARRFFSQFCFSIGAADTTNMDQGPSGTC